METRFIDGIAARLFPHRPCLTASVAARLLLKFKQMDSILILGVKTDETGQLMAHAWLKTPDNMVVAGRNVNLDKYNIVGVFLSLIHI